MPDWRVGQKGRTRLLRGDDDPLPLAIHIDRRAARLRGTDQHGSENRRIERQRRYHERVPFEFSTNAENPRGRRTIRWGVLDHVRLAPRTHPKAGADCIFSNERPLTVTLVKITNQRLVSGEKLQNSPVLQMAVFVLS